MPLTTIHRLPLAPAALALALAACAADPASLTKFPSHATGDGDGDQGADDESGDGDGDDSNGDGDANGDGDTNQGDGDMACSETSKSAPPPASNVDIVWVVDASGSMLDETTRVKMNLAKFANDITAASLDVQIIMLTESPAIPVICSFPDDPMEGTPLAGDPRYHFVKSGVDSHNLLDVAVNSFDKYKGFLRPNSAVNFVFLTDDESTYKGLPTPDMRSKQFQKDMTAKLGRGFVAHTISSEGPDACNTPNCTPDSNSGLCVFAMLGCGASDPGLTYYALADATNGLTSSICQSDWSKIFTPLTQAVIESVPLPCEYAIPAPPDGETLDPALVNVRYEPASGDSEVFPKAEGQAACGDKLGWHYDDTSAAPQSVMLCPAACERVKAGGSLNVGFGCKSIELL